MLANDRVVVPRLLHRLRRRRRRAGPLLGRITAPTLAITGSDDPGSTPDMSHRLAEAIPGARAEIVPGRPPPAAAGAPRELTDALDQALREDHGHDRPHRDPPRPAAEPSPLSRAASTSSTGERAAPAEGEYFDERQPHHRPSPLRGGARHRRRRGRAVGAAPQAAFENPAWRDLSQTRRGRLLRGLGDLIGENAELLARTETLDNGKLLREMRAQMAALPEYYYYFAGLADKIHGEVIPGASRSLLNYTLREPLGVVRRDHPLELAADADHHQAGAGSGRRQHRW